MMTTEIRHDWSIEELRERLFEDGIRADYSTVFRAVARLAEEGELERVELWDGRAHFEVRGDAHHDHLSCDQCAAVVAVPCVLVEEALSRISAETGFVLKRHSLVMSGTCSRCQLTTGDSSGRTRAR